MPSNQTKIFNYPKEHRFCQILAALAFTILVAGAFYFLVYVDLFVAKTPFSQQDAIFLILATSTLVVFGLIPLIGAFSNRSIVISNQGISGLKPGIRTLIKPKRIFISWNEIISLEEIPGSYHPMLLLNSYLLKAGQGKSIVFLENIEEAGTLRNEIVSRARLIPAKGYRGFQYSKPEIIFTPEYISTEKSFNKIAVLTIATAIAIFFFIIVLLVKSAGGVGNFLKIILGKP